MNFAQGYGLVYNHGQHILSTTTPFYAILLGVLAHVYPNIPPISNFIGCAALIGASVLLIQLLPKDIPGPLRALAGALSCLMMNPLSTIGSEVPLYIFFIALTMWLFELNQPVLTGIASGLTALTRPDGLVTIVVVLFNQILRRKRRDAVKTFLCFIAVVTPWLVYSISEYGGPFPVTLKAKQHQAHLLGNYGYLRGLLTTLNFVRKDYGNAIFVLAGLIGVAGVAILIRRKFFPPLLQWALLYIAGYTILGVVYYHWYYSGLFPVGIYIVTIALGAFHKKMRGFSAKGSAGANNEPNRLSLILPAVATIVLVAPIALKTFELAYQRYTWPPAPPGYILYRPVGEWINKNTPRDSTVGGLQIGIMGYYSQRTIIDFAGLIEPDIARCGGREYTDWGKWAIKKYDPDYVAMDFPWGNPIVKETWFIKEYLPIKQFSFPNTWSVTIYRKIAKPDIHSRR